MTMTTVRQVVSVKPTDLRMNDAYIFYYNNLAKLIITGIVPFVALCVFNTKVKYPPQSLWYFPAQQYKKWIALGTWYSCFLTRELYILALLELRIFFRRHLSKITFLFEKVISYLLELLQSYYISRLALLNVKPFQSYLSSRERMVWQTIWFSEMPADFEVNSRQLWPWLYRSLFRAKRINAFFLLSDLLRFTSPSQCNGTTRHRRPPATAQWR